MSPAALANATEAAGSTRRSAPATGMKVGTFRSEADARRRAWVARTSLNQRGVATWRTRGSTAIAAHTSGSRAVRAGAIWFDIASVGHSAPSTGATARLYSGTGILSAR